MKATHSNFPYLSRITNLQSNMRLTNQIFGQKITEKEISEPHLVTDMSSPEPHLDRCC
jgi:hypothetical protein